MPETAVNQIRDIIFNLDGAQPQRWSNELSIAIDEINQISQYDDIKDCHNQEVIKAVQKVHEAVQTAFVYSRGYVSKVHSLAEYILDEEQHTIQSVKEGNYQDFKDYLEKVLERSQKCQKDIAALIEFIEKGHNELEEQKAVVTQIQGDAQERARSDGNQAGVAGAAAIAGVAVTVATSSALSIALVFGLLIFAVKKYFDYRKSAQIVAHCEKARKAIEDMRKGLMKIKETLNKVNAGLKTEIDNNYSNIKIDEEKFKRRSGPVLRSVTQNIKEVSQGAIKVKEYCQPLAKAKDMNDFIKKMTNN